MTDDLIARLGAHVKPVAPFQAVRRLAMGLTAGLAVSAAIMLSWLGLRDDLAAATATAPFWIKFSYTLATAAAMLWLLERLARPGANAARQRLIAFAPLTVMLTLGAGQWIAAEPDARLALTLGGSYHVCPWRIVVLSGPLLIGMLWALRGLAPTRPGLTGAVAGLASGAAGAFVYAFHCGESAMPFVAVFYTLGIGLSGLIGAVAGKRLLRW